MPAVVPQLKSITLGGAVAGVGIEATSFRQGLVHDTIVAMDILTGDGRIVRCTADNEHRDLFRGFPNSYGTLGYALRLRAETIPTQPMVRLEHRSHAVAADFFRSLAEQCRGDAVERERERVGRSVQLRRICGCERRARRQHRPVHA